MTLRDDLIPTVDEARGLVDELGFRMHAVVVRKTTWSGGEVGKGTASHVDVTLSPKPKVASPPPHHVFAAPGKYQDGDLTVSRISALYTESQLTGGTLTVGQEVVWLIDGERYLLVGKPDRKPLEWRVQLRKRVART